MDRFKWLQANNNEFKLVQYKLKDQYQVIGFLGGGGFSNVYKMRHKTLRISRALKIMDPCEILKGFQKQNETGEIKNKFDEINERFFREARAYSKIKHPNIVDIIDINCVSDKDYGIEIPYLILDYINGDTLRKKLKNGVIPGNKEIFRISKEILSALETIHRKAIVHRDIKSSNIIIEQEAGKAMLIDFGLAKDLLSISELTEKNVSMGTAPYKSPEQWRNFKDVDKTADIYSFGIILYEMFTGKRPYNEENCGNNIFTLMHAHCEWPIPNAMEANPNVPVGIDKLIYKAMAKKPVDRYQSAAELSTALQKIEKRLY